jgi:putative transposase
MARPLRPLLPGGVYHVMARGNDKGAIYLDDEDHAAFLGILARTVSRFGWRCFSHCLMGNHFHLLIQTPEPNLPRGAQYLKTVYAQHFNRRHEHTGHVFGGRYKSPLIQQDAHLLEVFRYIALNPVRAGLCRGPLDWRWSAHRALVGAEPPPRFLDVEGAHSWFGSTVDRRRYEAYVKRDHPVAYEPRGAVYGDDECKRSTLPATRPDPNIAMRDWGDGRPPLPEILERSTGPEAIWIAYRRYGYTLTGIAAERGCHVATVSRHLERYEREMLDCKV